MIVVDASVLAPALADDGTDGDRTRARLQGETLAAPELIDLEVASILRRLHFAERLPDHRAELAVSDLVALPLRRVSHRSLLARCFEPRENLTVYGAAHVALAELLGVVFLTADRRLSRSPGITCQVDVLLGATDPAPPGSEETPRGGAPPR